MLRRKPSRAELESAALAVKVARAVKAMKAMKAMGEENICCACKQHMPTAVVIRSGTSAQGSTGGRGGAIYTKSNQLCAWDGEGGEAGSISLGNVSVLGDGKAYVNRKVVATEGAVVCLCAACFSQ